MKPGAIVFRLAALIRNGEIALRLPASRNSQVERRPNRVGDPCSWERVAGFRVTAPRIAFQKKARR